MVHSTRSKLERPQNLSFLAMTELIQKYRLDCLIGLALALGVAIACFLTSQQISADILNVETGGGGWFEADVPIVFGNMTDLGSDHYRVSRHPLFSAIAFFLVYPFRKLGVEPLLAVRLVTSAIAALWTSLLFLTLRLIQCRPLDAALFSLLGVTSAASFFWFTVPETYALGSLSIVLGLATVALSTQYRLPEAWYVVMSAFTFSITVTNWVVGISATLVQHPWRRTVQITVNAFALVTLLWGVQKFIFPTAGFFLGDRWAAKYILTDYTGGPLEVIRSFALHTMVMPAIQTVTRYGDKQIMITQLSGAGSGGVWGAISVGLWSGLLLLGLWQLFSLRKQSKFRLVLGGTLLAQLVLHVIFGEETFLYSLHFAPLLVTLAALGSFTRARFLVLGLTAVLIVTVALNNMQQFQQALKFFSL
jgi:hypothetical protein